MKTTAYTARHEDIWNDEATDSVIERLNFIKVRRNARIVFLINVKLVSH